MALQDPLNTDEPNWTGAPEDDDPLYCRTCNGYLGQRVDATPETVTYWNGWPHCPEHAAEMQRLAKVPDSVEEVRRI